MLLDDKLLSRRLRDEPEFLLRMYETVVTWGIEDRPALIIQARPAGTASATVGMTREIKDLVRAGTGDVESNWSGFQSSFKIGETVHGIASVSNWTQPSWVFEAHNDGHFVAGIWDFPSIPDAQGNQEHQVVTTNYAGVFRDFFALTNNIARVGQLSGNFVATATLLRANELRYALKQGSYSLRIASEPSPLKNQQWLVYEEVIATDAWQALETKFTQGLAAACGHRR